MSDGFDYDDGPEQPGELERLRVFAGRIRSAVGETSNPAALEKVESLHAAADGYAGDLAAIVRTMNRHGYPHHPEYPNDDEIIRRIVEMAAKVRTAYADGFRAGRDALVRILEGQGFDKVAPALMYELRALEPGGDENG